MPKHQMTESVIIRPASTRYGGQDADFSMFDYLQNEFESDKIHAVLTHVPYDISAKMQRLESDRAALLDTAKMVIDSWEKGDLAATVRALDRAVKEVQS
jgi:hypothetical protein